MQLLTWLTVVQTLFFKGFSKQGYLHIKLEAQPTEPVSLT
jgi:hypothetical protein